MVNTGGLSTTDPNYLSYPDGNWRVDALGFSCSSTERITINGKDETQTVVVKSKSNIKNNRTVGIKDGKNQEVRLKVYPNPAIEMVNVEVSLVKETKATITIENMLGQVVYTSEIKHQKSEINISTFVSGVYFVKVNTGKGVVVEKIIIE